MKSSFCIAVTVTLWSGLEARAMDISSLDLNRERDFMLVKSEIVNRLGAEYRPDTFKFDESRLDREVLRNEYLYRQQKMANPYQYPAVNQLFYKKKDLYEYVTNKYKDHEHWVGYASKFMHKFDLKEYDTFVNFSNRPFSQLFGEFMEAQRLEAKKWRETGKLVHSDPKSYLLNGPLHPHKITGVDKLHDMGFNGEGAEVIVWDCGFVENCHVNFNPQDEHVLSPKTKDDYKRGQLHGTHVSGIIAADKKSGKNKGVAFNAEVLPVDYNGVDELFSRIKYSPAKIISASFHYLVDRLSILDFDRLAGELEKNDRILVMASGNESKFMTPENNPNFLTYWSRGIWMGTHSSWILNKNPKLAERVLFVGSLKEDGETISRFSNLPGIFSDTFVFAPGENVLSTVAFDKFDKMSGTSMATPHVSGVLTLMSKYNPTLNALELKDCLLNSCDKFWEDLQLKPEDQKPEIFGRGRINAVNAMQRAEELSKSKIAAPPVAVITAGYIQELGMDMDGDMTMDTVSMNDMYANDLVYELDMDVEDMMDMS